MPMPTAEEYHEALNGLWTAFAPEFRSNADLFVVRRMVNLLKRGYAAGLPLTAALDAPRSGANQKDNRG